MTIASRTPEGLPHRCPICGSECRVDPSAATGDAPCPACGNLLLWFRERFGEPAAPITPETRILDDLSAESIDIVELVMEFEDVFRIAVPDEEYERIETVADAIRLIRRLRGED